MNVLGPRQAHPDLSILRSANRRIPERRNILEIGIAAIRIKQRWEFVEEKFESPTLETEQTVHTEIVGKAFLSIVYQESVLIGLHEKRCEDVDRDCRLGLSHVDRINKLRDFVDSKYRKDIDITSLELGVRRRTANVRDRISILVHPASLKVNDRQHRKQH